MTASLSKNLAGSSANRAEQRSQINNEEDIPRFAGEGRRLRRRLSASSQIRRGGWEAAASVVFGFVVGLGAWLRRRPSVALLLCYGSRLNRSSRLRFSCCSVTGL
nr:hypothetical protein Itr_chr06CG24120 [Ipomoea trifida]